MITTVGFDGDDTLWHTESEYARTEERYRQILTRYLSGEQVSAHLFETEMANLKLYGYGVKSFTLSMIETALRVSDNQISAAEIASILATGKELLECEPQPIAGAQETLHAMAGRFHLLLITKGDLLDQENKLARTGLRDLFHAVEIVSVKDEATFLRVLARHRISASEFAMVGNSVRSDVLPALAAGGFAVHVPYDITWAHETASAADLPSGRFCEVRNIREVPDAITSLAGMN